MAFELVISEHLLEGLSRAWRKPYFQSRFAPEQVRQALSVLRSDATLVLPASGVIGIGEDLEDDLVLATAVAGGVDVLVTGDKHLQGLGHYQDIIILSQRHFLEATDDEA